MIPDATAEKIRDRNKVGLKNSRQAVSRSNSFTSKEAPPSQVEVNQGKKKKKVKK